MSSDAYCVWDLMADTRSVPREARVGRVARKAIACGVVENWVVGGGAEGQRK